MTTDDDTLRTIDADMVRALDKRIRASSFRWSLRQESFEDALWLIMRSTNWPRARAVAALEAFCAENRRPPPP